MTQLRQQMQADMVVRGLAPRTQRAYIDAAAAIACLFAVIREHGAVQPKRPLDPCAMLPRKLDCLTRPSEEWISRRGEKKRQALPPSRSFLPIQLSCSLQSPSPPPLMAVQSNGVYLPLKRWNANDVLMRRQINSIR
jgi:hypothetical protein